ncbi:MAG: glycosyltransferase family 39 protein [Armatimonadota bacterium]
MAAESVAHRPFGRSLLLPIVLLAALVFLTGLGRLPLFGRDEALYAEAAREMQVSGDWITPRVNGVFFFEKPPLLYWATALSYSALGPTPLAVRLPVALIAIFTVVLTVAVASRVWGKRVGLLAGVMLAACPLIAMVGRMGIMDMPLTCLVTLAVLAYARWRRTGGLAPAAAFGLLVGLAVLLKGLAGGLAPAIALVHSLVYRRSSPRAGVPPERHPAVAPSLCAERGLGGEVRTGPSAALAAALALVAALLIASPWFVAMVSRHGQAFVNDFIITQHFARMAKPMQGHGGSDLLHYMGYLAYYPALIVFAFFPWVAFLPSALRRRSAVSQPCSAGLPAGREAGPQTCDPPSAGPEAQACPPPEGSKTCDHRATESEGRPSHSPPSPDLERGPGGEDDAQAFWRGLAIVWFLVVLVPFSLIKTKLPGYIVPLFPPMAMLVAVELDRRLGVPPSRREVPPGRAAWIATVVGAAILAAVFWELPLIALLSDLRRDVPDAGSLLMAPSVLWAAGYVVTLFGGVQGLRRRARSGLALMAIGQFVVVGALLFAMLPVLSPYLGGGPAYLAQLAQRELPGRPIILYETRPETVNFVLRRAVPTFSHNEKDKLLAALRSGPTALIAPVKERAFWQSLSSDRQWRRGLDVLLAVSPMPKEGAAGVVQEGVTQPSGGETK